MSSYSALAKPTIRYCEANLNGLIAQPANSCSSLIISLVGIVILQRKKRHKFSHLLGWVTILVGLMSFAYHATYTFIGQLLDLGSMFLFTSFLIVAALRQQKLTVRQNILIIVLGTIIPVLLVATFKTIGGFNIGIPLFAILLLAAVTLEIKTSLREKRTLCFYGLASLVFWAGWMIWLLDYRGIWCDPASFHYINGHTIWHLSNAVAIWILDKHYAEINRS